MADSTTNGKQRYSADYPRFNLKEAERVARTVFELGARNVPQNNAAQAAGFTGVDNGAFKGRRAAARYFGLVGYEGSRVISVSQPWIDAFLAHDEEALRSLRQSAVTKPDLYRQIFERYAGEQLPSAQRLAQELYIQPKYGIRKDTARKATDVFLESVSYAELIDGGYLLNPDSQSSTSPLDPTGAPLAMDAPQPSAVHNDTPDNPLMAQELLHIQDEQKAGEIMQLITPQSVVGPEATAKTWLVKIEHEGCLFYFNPSHPLPKSIRNAIKVILEAGDE